MINSSSLKNIAPITMAWIVVVVFAVACFLVLEKFANVSHDAKEPTLIPQPIPYIGHLLGMLWKGSRYYTEIRSVPVDNGYTRPRSSLT